MKELSYHNPKMATYCQESAQARGQVRQPQANHIPRWLNEAADELAKMASGRELVPAGIFAGD
jgi:hypothetical protein